MFPTTYQRNRIYIQQHCRRATLKTCLWIENMRPTKRKRKRLHISRIFMQQKPHIGRGAVRRSNRQQHWFPSLRILASLEYDANCTIAWGYLQAFPTLWLSILANWHAGRGLL